MLSRRLSHRGSLRLKACVVAALTALVLTAVVRPHRRDAKRSAAVASDCTGRTHGWGNELLLSAMPPTANRPWTDAAQDDDVDTLPRGGSIAMSSTTLTAMPTIADVLGRSSGWVRMSLALYQAHLHRDVFEWFTMGLSGAAIRSTGGRASSRWGHRPPAVGEAPTVGTSEDAQVRALNHVVFWSVLREAAPRLVYAYSALDALHCDALIAMGNRSLKRSTVVLDGGSQPSDAPHTVDSGPGQGNVVDVVRTSSGTFLTTFVDRTSAANVALRVAAAYLLGVPEAFLEPTQILRYQAGEYYVPHLDYFGDTEVDELRRGGQRVATVLVWLNDVACGGETAFPAADVKITPVKGNAVVLYNVKAGDGLHPDPWSIHAGEPPRGDKDQVKWVAILWAHPRAYHAG